MHTLSRFVEAQRDMYETALAELRAGQKRSHWMWFVLPQIAGLGHSAMAQRYAIADRAEAEAYLAHPVLGRRLVETVEAVLMHPDKTARQIFGSPDDMKFKSCLTLFEAAGGGDIFERALEVFYGGEKDEETLRRLGRV